MCQVFLWGERGFSSATDNVPSPLAPPARGERRPRLAGVGEGALATELNAALRSGPRRFEVQDFASLIPVEESTALASSVLYGAWVCVLAVVAGQRIWLLFNNLGRAPG